MSPRHVVVDGSNIATEGRSLPSLAQLDQAVREFLGENPEDDVTVVVDASFGHRIDPAEVITFEEAEAAGEVFSPPAGAIGRGDAFLLRIAEKTGATVLSNDSFQEFHGEHEWLFEKGRLIGGKPVPGVGWIFTPRTPVRGPKSREAVKEAKRRKRTDVEAPEETAGLELAAGRAKAQRGAGKKVERAIAKATEEAVRADDAKPRRRRRGSTPPSEPVNDPMTFITFIASHPLGAEVEGTIDMFSSHGAFVIVEGARCYIPLSAMADPPPRAAREVLTKGEDRVFVVQALDPLRRGVELALPGYAHVAGAPTDETVAAEMGEDLLADDDEPIAAPTNLPEAGTTTGEPLTPSRRGRRRSTSPESASSASTSPGSEAEVSGTGGGRGRRRAGTGPSTPGAPGEALPPGRPRRFDPASSGPEPGPVTDAVAPSEATEEPPSPTSATQSRRTRNAPSTPDTVPAAEAGPSGGDEAEAPTKAGAKKVAGRATAAKQAAAKAPAAKVSDAKGLVVKGPSAAKASAGKASAGKAAAVKASAVKASAGKASAGKASAGKAAAAKASAVGRSALANGPKEEASRSAAPARRGARKTPAAAPAIKAAAKSSATAKKSGSVAKTTARGTGAQAAAAAAPGKKSTAVRTAPAKASPVKAGASAKASPAKAAASGKAASTNAAAIKAPTPRAGSVAKARAASKAAPVETVTRGKKVAQSTETAPATKAAPAAKGRPAGTTALRKSTTSTKAALAKAAVGKTSVSGRASTSAPRTAAAPAPRSLRKPTK